MDLDGSLTGITPANNVPEYNVTAFSDAAGALTAAGRTIFDFPRVTSHSGLLPPECARKFICVRILWAHRAYHLLTM